MNIPPSSDPIDNKNENDDQENKESTILANAIVNSRKKQEKTDENVKGMNDNLRNLIRIGTVIEPTLDEKEKENDLQTSSITAGYKAAARVLVHLGVNHMGKAEKVKVVDPNLQPSTSLLSEDITFLEQFKKENQFWIEQMGDIEPSKLDARNKLENKNIRVWMQFTTKNAGVSGEWSPPSYGEQVLILCINGDLSNAFIIGSLYRGAVNFRNIPEDKKSDTTNEQGAFGATKFPKCSTDVDLPKFGDNNYDCSFIVHGSKRVIGFNPNNNISWKSLYTPIKSNGKYIQYYVSKLLEQTDQLVQEKDGDPAYGESTKKIFHSENSKKPLVIQKATIKNSSDDSTGTYIGSTSTKIFSTKDQGNTAETVTQVLASEELTINKDLGGIKKTTLHRVNDKDNTISSFINSTSVTEKGVKTQQELQANATENLSQLFIGAEATKNSSLFLTKLKSTSNNERTLALLQLETNHEGEILLQAYSDNNEFCKIGLHAKDGITISTSSGTCFSINKEGAITIDANRLDVKAKEIIFDGRVKFTQPVTCASKLTVEGKLDIT